MNMGLQKYNDMADLGLVVGEWLDDLWFYVLFNSIRHVRTMGGR